MSNRKERAQERKTICDINNVGRRIEWVRLKLGLLQKEVAHHAGVPVSSYCDREAGVRTGLYEELLAIAVVLNTLWQNKYKTSFPRFNGIEMPEITILWLLFGEANADNKSREIIESLKKQLIEKELLLKLQEEENRRQLALFTDEALNIKTKHD